MAGGMGVRKNVHIENWAAYRENCEHVFKFTRGAWARLAIFGFAVPYAAYRAIIYELETPGHAVGRGPEKFNMRRNYWGGSGGTRKEPQAAAAAASADDGQ